jgi:hypothetical protein
MNGLAVAALALTLGAVDGPVGAAQLEKSTALQRTARTVWPSPAEADADRSRAYDDGCHLSLIATRFGNCVYGDPGSSTTVVLFGDSHALQYFPALEPIARAHGWRLVHLSKGGCPPPPARLDRPGRTRMSRSCRVWRELALQRIERERPALVVTSGSTGGRIWRHGHRLPRAESDAIVARGWVRTLRRLAKIAPRVVAIRDSPRPSPDDEPSCVAAHMRELRRCAFPRPRRPAMITRAQRSVRGVTVIDPIGMFCPRDLCPAVIGNVLVWRSSAHMTATYSATMSRWLERRLPALK